MMNKIISIKNLRKMIDNMNKDKISEYSSQSAYYTILSFIPFLVLLITLIQYTNIDQQTLFNVISKIVPSSMEDFIIGIVKEVYSKSLGTISISILFTLWSAGRGLLALIRGLHAIYDVDDKKTNSVLYLKIISIAQTIVFIVLLVLGLVALVFGNSLVSILKERFGILDNFNMFSGIATQLGLIIITFVVFELIYTIIPRHKVTFKSQIAGAFLGAIGLNLISFIFSRYLDIFKGFSITYGSLTTLMLIMMWTYSCFYTLFLGAELNKTLKNIDN